MTEQPLKKAGKRGYSLLQRQEIIRLWKASGKSKKDFCQELGINYYTLMSWLGPQKKQRGVKSSKLDHKAPGFSQVKLEPKATGILFARITQGKIVVDLFQVVSPEFFRQLLTA